MRIALKVDVDTLRGALEGVPALAELLAKRGVPATFLFSVGPDNTGRAIRRIFRPGFLRKVFRTSVASHYGWRTLCYGTLLPGPDIGRRGAAVMRAVRDAGFEVGVHAYDHIRWQDQVAHRDEAWTRREMDRAVTRFQDIFQALPATFGAAGWQLNVHALQRQQELGFAYCSDTRGTHPFLPAMAGRRFSCPQLPTTLPTMDELIGRHGITADKVADHLLTESARALPAGHVFTLHAELEGMALLGAFTRLLAGWREQGYALGSLGELYATLDPGRLPCHAVVNGEVAGRSGLLAVQGPELMSSGAAPLRHDSLNFR